MGANAIPQAWRPAVSLDEGPYVNHFSAWVDHELHHSAGLPAPTTETLRPGAAAVLLIGTEDSGDAGANHRYLPL
jgi:hypothetical protein